MGPAIPREPGAGLAAREVVAAVSPLPVSRTLILEDAIGLSVAIPRFRTYFIVGLAGLAAVLALLGMYGVLAFSVAQRTKEIGVRMALGAQAGEVVRAVIGSGMKLALGGGGDRLGRGVERSGSAERVPVRRCTEACGDIRRRGCRGAGDQLRSGISAGAAGSLSEPGERAQRRVAGEWGSRP
ncbi:MAG: hypothetical protein IPM24_20045, partial [Bryobacterales bacterium]|nr:hypothetical protein [Bryobacterales bacterium]